VARRSGLGKGLDALIPTGSGGTPPTGGSSTGLREISVTAVHPNPNQPRVYFDEEALAELTSSVRAIGVLQPILVRPRGDNEFELIAGERRWRAATRAGLSTIPAIVRVTDDVSSVEQALVENLHRQDLTPLEEAAAYKQLQESLCDHQLVATACTSCIGPTTACRWPFDCGTRESVAWNTGSSSARTPCTSGGGGVLDRAWRRRRSARCTRNAEADTKTNVDRRQAIDSANRRYPASSSRFDGTRVIVERSFADIGECVDGRQARTHHDRLCRPR
jgi:hypothetical protein